LGNDPFNSGNRFIPTLLNGSTCLGRARFDQSLIQFGNSRNRAIKSKARPCCIFLGSEDCVRRPGSKKRISTNGISDFRFREHAHGRRMSEKPALRRPKRVICHFLFSKQKEGNAI
jgi:hypothetical protein